jgi:adenylosuccinate synthase
LWEYSLDDRYNYTIGVNPTTYQWSSDLDTMAKAILTCGLGFGDEGKGTVVDALVDHTKADLVVRFNGGAQAAHNVVRNNGAHHSFHQYGSGSFSGCSTLLSKYMLVNPRYALKEWRVLSTQLMPSAWPKLYVDEEAVITTPWHVALNRCRESARRNNPHGSCGMGIGETMRWLRAYEATGDTMPPLRVKDLKLSYNDLCDTLEPLREVLKSEADAVLHGYAKSGNSSDYCDVFKLREFPDIVSELQAFAKLAVILPHSETVDLVAHSDSVFEASQGVLLDEDYGFHPYTTWSHCTLKNAEELVKEAGVQVTQRLGIIRTYMTRHGPGPFPGELPNSARQYFPEHHNADNAWQHDWRVGVSDFAAWKYALDAVALDGHGHAVDSLAITHVDRCKDIVCWPILTEDHYRSAAIRLSDHLHDPTNFTERENLTERLMGAKFEPDTISLGTHPTLVSFIEDRLGLPAILTSHGPKTGDKVFFPGYAAS